MKTQLVGSIKEYRLGKIPSPSHNRRYMIETFDYIEIWNIDKLSKIPKHMNIGIGKIIEEHHIDKNIKENPYNLETSWRNISKGKSKLLL